DGTGRPAPAGLTVGSHAAKVCGMDVRSRWQVMATGIVTPKGNASTLDAPGVLLGRFAPIAGGRPPLTIPFDRSVTVAQAAYRSCDLIHDAVEQALIARKRPLLLGGECSLIAGSLSAAVDRIPNLHAAFLDAHGDFNTAQTSPSQYLGGMCFAHACGLFNAGLPWRAASPFPGKRAFLIGGRQLDPGEDANMQRAGVLRVDPSGEFALKPLREALQRAPLWIHVDLDVVDPSENFAVSHPVPGGISFARLATLLGELAALAEIRGVEICGYQPAIDPQRALPSLIAAAMAPLLS
ncbi:MAG TPA: arginase family protein, partial [Myxococcaceae bacterium]|nr:arginase family protein [Myxococcaceae bacterium]